MVWVRRSFFGSLWDGVITVLIVYVLAGVGINAIRWLFVDSVWGAHNAQLCGDSGACWSVIADRYRLIFFGLYPHDEQWRSAIACVVVIVMVVLSCLPKFFDIRRLAFIWGVGFALYVLLMRGGLFGLQYVPTDRWGGLALTLYIYAAVILIGMPLAIALALARRTRLPAIRMTIAAIVDMIRSLPLLTILFTFSLIIPFVLPSWAQGDKLHRVILGFAFFFACYQSESIRGGLQAIPHGQDEVARALGLTPFQRLRLVILPQAFRNSMPMTINQFIVTFKETSIIVIVGLFEFMASAGAAYQVAEWSPYFKEVLVFIALIYFCFAFSLSLYGRFLEHRMRVGAD